MARRILVALDDTAAGPGLVDLAARLAAGRQAELLGLHVEDTEFVSAAGLPFSRTLSRYGGAWEAADPDSMARALRARSAELHQHLERAARQWRLSWSFRSERGTAGERLPSAADEAELSVLLRCRPGRGGGLGRTARRTAERSASSVLLLDAGGQVPRAVTAVYRGDDRVLEAGAELADLFGRPLQIAVCEDPRERERLHADARAWLRARGRAERVHDLPGDDPAALAAALSERPPGLAVVAGDARVAGLDLGGLLERMAGPVLVLR